MTTKPDLTRVWASGAPGGNVEDPDVTVPGKFAAGWEAEIPPFENFNFLQQLFTQALAHANEFGIMQWDTDTEYPLNGWARSTVDNEIYISLTASNQGNEPSASPAQWQILGNFIIASQAEARAGTNNTKGMTPLRTKEAFNQYGLGDGVEAGSVYGGDVRDIDYTGFTRVISSATNIPVATNGYIISIYRVANNVTLIYIPDSSNVAEMYISTKNTTWTDWTNLVPTGVNQTWQDVSGSRSDNTIYTNTTGRPIMVSIKTTGSIGGNSRVSLEVDGINVAGNVGGQIPTITPESTVTAIVPDGSTYRVGNSLTTVGTLTWYELR